MGARLSDWLHRQSTGWVTLAALVVFLLFTALVLPNQAAQADAETGGAGSPDTSLVYTPAALYRLAEAYGPAGRRAYIRARFTFDVIWPLVYTAFLGAAISWLYRRAFPAGSVWQRLNLAPVLGALLDYLENVATSLVMARYPLRTPVVAELAPVFTLLKWICVGGSFALLLIGAGVGLWRWLQRQAGAGQ
jgi:hypothetical protein